MFIFGQVTMTVHQFYQVQGTQKVCAYTSIHLSMPCQAVYIPCFLGAGSRRVNTMVSINTIGLSILFSFYYINEFY